MNSGSASKHTQRKGKIGALYFLTPHIDGKNGDLVSILENLIMDNVGADYPIIVVHYNMGKEPLRLRVEYTLGD